MQNRCLRMITGAFRTTNIAAMEIEVSIPPIDIWLNYKLEMEALQLSRLADNHPVACHLYPDQRDNLIPPSPPPLLPYGTTKRYRISPRTKLTTCITRISNRMIEGTETISLNAEPPWRISELEIPDRVKIFTPPMASGCSVKEQWKDNHINFVTELEDNTDFLFVYSDGSLTEERGRRRTGYGVIRYNNGEVVFKCNSALGEHAEVYDAEMMGIHMLQKRQGSTWQLSIPFQTHQISYSTLTMWDPLIGFLMGNQEKAKPNRGPSEKLSARY